MSQATEDLIWEVRRLFRELATAGDEALAPLGITTAERALLEFLAREQAPVSLSEIARKRSVSRQHIHQTLARLDPDWVERTVSPTDARAVVLSLSRKGRTVWNRIRAVDADLLQRLDRPLGEKEVRAAIATLRKVRETLKTSHEERP